MGGTIVADGLTKRFGSTVALDGLSLEVGEGEVFGFLGPNGAGKTTTVRLLLGLLQPTAGAASILGLDPWRDTVAVHRRLAYVPGEAAIWPQLTGAETLGLLGNLHGGVDVPYRDELVERFDLDPTKKGRSYSKGNRQKIGLIAALATRAEVLILDEPTSGLDPLMEVTFRDCVADAKERGQTVFLSSHILSEVEALCDRVAMLRAGRLVDVGSLEQLRGLSAQHVDIVFAGPAPDLSSLPGVEVVEADDRRVRLRSTGSTDALVKALAAHEVVALTSREPSLEELFLAYYGPEPGA